MKGCDFVKKVAKSSLISILFFCFCISQALADVGGSLSFSLTKGNSKVVPGLISIGQALLLDQTLVSFFPDSQAVGLTVGTHVEIAVTFLPGDEENDREMVENGELRIEGYLQGGKDAIPMKWIPSQTDYFIGYYSFDIPIDGSVRGGHNVVFRIWSTKGITEWVIVFIPIDTHQEGNSIFSPYAVNIELPKKVGWETHPIDFCSNVYGTDGSGYYSWTDAKQMNLYKQNNQIQQTVQSSAQTQQSSSSTVVSISQIFQEFLEVKTTSGKIVKETNGFFFITSKPFDFLTVVTEPTDIKKELYRGKVTSREWKKITEDLFVFVPNFSGFGRVFIDNKTNFEQNPSQVTEKVGEMTTFLHDFSKYQVVEIHPKGGR